MAKKTVEVILMRQLASYLATPVFIVDPSGRLIFFNEAAERILGIRFEETGEMPREEWATVFHPTDVAGKPIQPEKIPLARAISDQRSAQATFWIRGLDQVPRLVEATAFPLIGQGERPLGAVAVFREIQQP